MKTILIIISIILLQLHSNASVVSRGDAENVAVNYFKLLALTKQSIAATLVYSKSEADGSVDFYVFDMAPEKGFVIVSAYDHIQPILAYSTESNFKIDTKNRTGVNDWMQERATKIAYGARKNAQADEHIKSLWSAYKQGVMEPDLRSGGVPYLVQTLWDQEDYIQATNTYLYNEYCPFNSTDNQRCLTGCVATAMAQVMKYWNYPAAGISGHSYTADPYGTQSASFENTLYKWSDMPNTLNASSTTAQNDAVSTLMYHCGVGVEMAYGDDKQGGSGASVFLPTGALCSWFYCTQCAISGYFAYDCCTPNGNPMSSVNAELDAGRPCLITNDDGIGSHCWIADGYNLTGNGHIHFNFGWGGIDNGYYSVDSINPVVPAPVPEGFSFSSLYALTGIMPISSCEGNNDLGSGGYGTFMRSSSGTFNSENTIINNSNNNITLTAATAIILRPGFNDINGTGISEFRALIQPCESPLPANSLRQLANNDTSAVLATITSVISHEDIQIIPNPFNYSFELSLDGVNADKASVVIYNMIGDRIKELNNWNIVPGNNKISFDCSQFANGVYIVEINEDNSRTVKKIVKN